MTHNKTGVCRDGLGRRYARSLCSRMISAGSPAVLIAQLRLSHRPRSWRSTKIARPSCPGMFGQSLVSNNRGALDGGREPEFEFECCMGGCHDLVYSRISITGGLDSLPCWLCNVAAHLSGRYPPPHHVIDTRGQDQRASRASREWKVHRKRRRQVGRRRGEIKDEWLTGEGQLAVGESLWN